MANPNPSPETRFQPGNSANPGGRPKGIAKLAREKVGDDPSRLLDVLLEIAENPRARNADRINAAREYLDRAWGKSLSYEPLEDPDALEMNDVEREIMDIANELEARRKNGFEPAAG